MNRKNEQDIPAPVAIVGLIVILGAIYYLNHRHVVDGMINLMNSFVELESTFITFQGLLFLINGLIFIWLLPTGRKRSLKDHFSTESSFSSKIFIDFSICILVSIQFYIFMPRSEFSPQIERFVMLEPLSFIIKVGKINCALSAGLFVFLILHRRRKNVSIRLPTYVKHENEIILGSENEGLTRPDWVRARLKSLNGNVLVTGSIGSGKTQGTILPYLEQILHNLNPKPAILCIDPKGTFVNDVKRITVDCGRGNDLVHVKLGGSETFNPIYMERSLKGAKFLRIASMLHAAASNVSRGRTSQDFWEVSSSTLVKNLLVHAAATKSYYTLNDLYQAATNATSSKLSDDLVEVLKESTDFDVEERFNIESSQRYFEKEFGAFEDKLKTNIIATTTKFLNQFQEYQAAKIFCPSGDEVTISSMDKAIAESKIIIFDVTEPGLSKAMGTFFKLCFEQAILDRLRSNASSEIPAIMVIDEYQDVVSVGHNGTLGDDTFLAKCREANAVVIAATQSLSSLENALGSIKATNEICQNFRTRIACHSADHTTIKAFQELVGDYERERFTEGFSRQKKDLTRSILMGETKSHRDNYGESISLSTSKEPIIAHSDFSNLRIFEAFALVFDGIGTRFHKIYLKPYFLKHKPTSHCELIASMKKTKPIDLSL